MQDLVVLAIAMATFGQVCLCVTLLSARAFQVPTYLPLAAFFLSHGVIALGPAVFLLLQGWETIYIAAMLPAWLLLSPTCWFYVEGLTAERCWRPKLSHLWHFVPFAAGLILAIVMVSVPEVVRKAVFLDDVDIVSGTELLVVAGVFIAMLVWMLQSGYYLARVILRLSRYRKQLKDLFASNEHRELGWLSWLLAVLLVTWVLSFSSLLSSLLFDLPLFGHRAGALLSLILVWTMGHWGLRQKPGFDGRYLDKINVDEQAGVDERKKYTRSALGKDQAARIAKKITDAMTQDHLHLDPSLSLHKLAQHVAISPNYISQTLNETMETNFFDFVNKWRIESAKPKILANDDSVLTIALAVGFNARSSFYKVFKRETGTTPSEFRKRQQSSQG